MKPRIILDKISLGLTIERLCHQLIENHNDFSKSAIIGIQSKGAFLAQRIHQRLKSIHKGIKIDLGKLDIAFYRDDFRRSENPLIAKRTEVEFPIEDRRVILVDDVLYTGRTIRAALDALVDLGRPGDVELLVLIDRRLHRHLPIQAKYVGKTVDSIVSERVQVEWNEIEGEDKVWISNES